MNIKKLLAISILTILFLSCSSEENKELMPEYVQPEVSTLDAVTGTNGGVYLSGNYISNGNGITEVGFELSVDSLFNTKTQLISELNSNDEISYFLANGIEENVKYFYKAFLKSSGDTFYGLTKSFISDGSVSPRIDSISHDFGHIADTLEIYGKYFKDNNYQTFVDFSNTNGQIISLNDSVIKCKVPTNIKNVISDLRVRIDNRVDAYSSFSLFEPTIETVDPIIGVIGDTLSLIGNHFDIVNVRNKVFFGNVQSIVIESNRENIKVVVPENIESPTEQIQLNAQLQDVTYDVAFQLAAPKINAVSPLNATFRDEITITGDNFDFKKTRNKVFFGNIEATITYADKNTLKVIVPDDLESSSEPIKVVAQLQEVVYGENFQIKIPEISFIQEDVNVNQDITIQGSYFHPVLDRNIITIENIEVNLSSGSTENLNTKIPLGPFPRRKAIVRLALLDLLVEYEVELNIVDKWVMVSNSLPFNYYRGTGAMLVNGNVYVVATPKIRDGEVYIWKFNPPDYTWDKIEKIPFQVGYSTVGSATWVSNGDKIYLYNANQNNEFYEFDTVSNQWSSRASFPGKRRDYPTHFSIDGEIYIGLGVDFEPYTSVGYIDFYKYNPLSDAWVQVADVPLGIWGGIKRTETGTFVIDGIGYFTGGAFNTGDVDCWSYHPNTDEWIRISDFNDSRRYTSSFELNGFGYVTGGTPTGGSNRNDCWRYDPTSDNWIQVDDIGHIQRGGHFSFSLNGKAYVGGGGIYASGGITGYDFYEFIP